MRIISWIKVIVSWLLVKSNRAKSLRTLSMTLGVLENVAKLTKSKKDDFIIEATKRNITKLLIGLPEEEAINTINKINKASKGPLKEVNIGFDKDKGFNGGLSIKF